jgi:hypothetical protein
MPSDLMLGYDNKKIQTTIYIYIYILFSDPIT